MTAITTPSAAHPRFRERQEAVHVDTLRARNRKLIAAGLLVVAGLLAAASTQSPLLDVDEVRVVGAVDLAPDAVRETAAVGLGEPLIGLDLDAAARRLRAIPQIADVAASRDWRGVVTLVVAERTPVARFQSDDVTTAVSADGVVLSVSATPAPELPLISGAMFSAEPGDRVPIEVRDALAVAAALPHDVGAVVERVELSVDTLSLRLVGGGLVALGDARDLETKFEALRAFLAEVQLTCLQMLNVQAPMVPVIVRTPGCA